MLDKGQERERARQERLAAVKEFLPAEMLDSWHVGLEGMANQVDKIVIRPYTRKEREAGRSVALD